MDTITPRQRDFAVALLTERLVTLQAASLDEAVQRLHLDSLTKADARKVIDRLIAIPVDPDPEMPAVVAQSPRKGVNSKAGTCTGCKGAVPAGQGFYYKGTGWQVHHKVGACVAPAEAAAQAERVDSLQPGLYNVDGLGVVLVYTTGNDRLAGKMKLGRTFKYAMGTVMQVRAGLADGTAHRVSAQEAREFGYSNSHCIACGLSLDDPRSDPAKGGAGYGPVCARKYGWPWG